MGQNFQQKHKIMSDTVSLSKKISRLHLKLSLFLPSIASCQKGLKKLSVSSLEKGYFLLIQLITYKQKTVKAKHS